MTATPFFHVGFLVFDLEEAMDGFGEAFGVGWTGRTTTASRFWEPERGMVEIELDIAYSIEGPPHIELLEATDDGLYAARHGEGFHHIGTWDPTPRRWSGAEDSEALGSVGTRVDAAGEVVVSYLDPARLHGVMLEMVDERRRPMMERWLAGGPFVD